MVISMSAAAGESFGGRLRRWSGEWRRMAALPLAGSTPERVGRLYDIVGTRNLFGEESLFINLGYWRDDPATLDEASADLARLVGREAGLGAEDVLVDVGFGYGDQDFLWAREFGPRRIVGVNVAEEQIAIARERAAELGLAEVIEYVHGSASALPVGDGSATKVTALESAFHFPSYTQFFGEAHRVLAPGGRLVTADIVPRVLPGAAGLSWSGRDVFDAQRYRKALLEAGFETAHVYSIRRDVYGPLARYLRSRLREQDMRRVNPVLRLAFSRTGVRLWGPWADYIIAVAVKGGERPLI
ncbi:methyltransferase domain-containing protein [Nocardia uniformis]|uniref:Methyltransferase domain-containing protein n=1 Tax=Nocardia uniformis TaxID=53432 RepID=A0A849C020_9NOCA|nr:class I SAM-dependent methyltransferase [Nocardia uniformis]NNH70938.1 methyltransferase domain-containing protein [Nocardia uniformis]